MSLNINPLQPVEIIDHRLDISSMKRYGVLRGGSDQTWQPFISSSASASNIQITANPPNSQAILDPFVLWQVAAVVSFSCASNTTAPTKPLINLGSWDAPRAFPLARICTTMTVKMGNGQVTTQLYEYWSALMRYHTGKNDIDGDYSMTPCYPDQYQEYQFGLGKNRNPLADYGSNPYETPRGAFPLQILSNPVGGTTATINCVFTEPILVSPFVFGNQIRQGFCGITTQSYSFTMASSQGGLLWSHDRVSAEAGGIHDWNEPTYTIAPGGAQVLHNFLTMPPNIPIPPKLTYPYYQVTPYITSFPAIAPGAAFPMTMSAIQLASIPNKMYIYARLQDQLMNSTTSDSFMKLNNISINWNNKTGILSSATPQQLYLIAAKNGYKGSWTQWNGDGTFNSSQAGYSGVGFGAILCLEFGKDIPLGPTEAPGLLGNYQLQLTANVTNMLTNQAVHPYDGTGQLFSLFCIVVTEGTFSIEGLGGSIVQQIGVLTQSDVLNAVKSNQVYNAPKHILGGDAKSADEDGEKAKKDEYSYLKDIAEITKHVAPAIKSVVDATSSKPQQGIQDYSELIDLLKKQNRKKSTKSKKKKRRGGDLMTRDELKAQMQDEGDL